MSAATVLLCLINAGRGGSINTTTLLILLDLQAADECDLHTALKRALAYL